MGAWKVILTVALARASTDVMSANELLAVQPVASSTQYCQVNTTSWAVRSLPSDHLRSSLRFQVIEVKSLGDAAVFQGGDIFGEGRDKGAVGIVLGQVVRV